MLRSVVAVCWIQRRGVRGMVSRVWEESCSTGAPPPSYHQDYCLVTGNSFLFAKTDRETQMFVKNLLFSPGAEGAIVQWSSVCWVVRVAELGDEGGSYRDIGDTYVDQYKLINSFPLDTADTMVANKILLRYRSCEIYLGSSLIEQ